MMKKISDNATNLTTEQGLNVQKSKPFLSKELKK